MKLPVTVISAVVDTHNLTMYAENGETITVPQGDPRIRDLVAKCVAADFDNGGKLHLTEELMAGKNHYAEVEKKSNGLVRFFKMAKSKFKEIAEKFCEPVAPQTLGKKPEPMVHIVNGEVLEPVTDEAGQLPKEEERPLTKGAEAVAEIMANAVNTSNASFVNVATAEIAKNTKVEEEVVVAVLGDNTVIHGIEQLDDQMKAVTAGVTSIDGMQLFLNRAASVKRGHSVEDLLKFVQKGELPFADDGTVLVYKRLKPGPDDETFVDCHSGNVKQRVGSMVHMEEKLVDSNRRRDCSNGLHVARRDYLRSFSGSVVVLCKLAPEDVIAVPEYDARKLRAKAYHIIARLSDSDARRVCDNQPMLDTELLANCVAGNHTPILEYVEITEGYGGGLKVTKVESPEQRAEAIVRAVTSLDEVPDVCNGPVTVDARAIALDMAAAGTKDTTVQTLEQDGRVIGVNPILAAPYGAQLSRSLTGEFYHAPPENMVVSAPVEPSVPATPPPAPVVKLNERDQLLAAFGEATVPSAKLEACKAILAYKKAKKKSWTALGIPTTVWTKAQEIVETAEIGAKNAITKADLNNGVAAQLESDLREEIKKPSPKPVKGKAAKANVASAKGSVTAQKKEIDALLAPAKATPKRKAELQQLAAVQPKAKKMTQAEEMAKLVKLYEANPDKANARAIFAFKQAAKKGWEKLGVTDVKFQKKITERAKL